MTHWQAVQEELDRLYMEYISLPLAEMITFDNFEHYIEQQRSTT